MATLNLPPIKQNSLSWGPASDNLPEKFKDLPYQPFKKQDLIGKVSDWTGATYGESRRARMYNASMGHMPQSVNQYGYIQEEDESLFTLVDNQKVVKPVYGRGPRGRYGQNNQNKNQMHQKNDYNKNQNKQQQKRRHDKRFSRPNWRNRFNITREPSIKVDDDWKLVETYELPSMNKLSLKEPIGADIVTAGLARAYNKRYDAVSVRNKQKLNLEFNEKIEFPYVTILEDEIIRGIAKNLEPKKVTVLATDNIISTIMCMSRSVTPWDLVAYKVTKNHNKQLVFDIDSERKEYSPVDVISVSETANEPLPQDDVDEINKPLKLKEEATTINQTFSQQILKYDKTSRIFNGQQRYPFEVAENKKMPSKLYRYRKIFLDGDKQEMQLIVRTEIDGYEVQSATATSTSSKTAANTANKAKNMPNFIKIHALNEWNSKYCNGIDWRKHLEKQTSTILATEIKNNSFKIAKWIMNAKMAEATNIKLGYVNRDNVKDNSVHNIVYMENYKPDTLASTAGLNIQNCWGVLRLVIDKIIDGNDGRYHIVRAPNEKEVSIYFDPCYQMGGKGDARKAGSDSSGSESGSEESGSDESGSESGSGSGSGSESGSSDEDSENEQKKSLVGGATENDDKKEGKTQNDLGTQG